ncbi:ZBT8A protein, partial [Cisticola juncidis]|nr:ZBT8A protein [Cisticola juncidis]
MEISSHQSHLLEQLNEQRKQDLFCDCNILVEGKVFKAHRNVLFASSGYFKMLLSQSSKETSQPTIATFEVFSPETFMVILDFVYSGILSLTGQNVIEVMSAASYLQMTDILNVCKTFIKSSLDINEKEKDHYLSLSAKSVSTEPTPARPALYRSRRKAKSNPRRSYSIPDEKPNGNENSWSSYSSYLSSEGILQRAETQLSKRGRKQGSARRRRKHLGLAQSRELGGGKADRAERAGASDPAHIPRGEEAESEAEFDAENDVDGDDFGYHPGAEAVRKRCRVPVAVAVPAGDLPRMRFKCPFCTHTVKRRADLKRHLRCHTGERPYPCEACGKRFTRLEHLRNHFQTIHQAGKLICRKCKRHVTELTGCVVQQGTRRYRLCHKCLAEASFDSIPEDFSAPGHSPVPSTGNKRARRALEEEQKSDGETMEEEPYDLVVRHNNEDIAEEVKEKVKPNLR